MAENCLEFSVRVRGRAFLAESIVGSANMHPLGPVAKAEPEAHLSGAPLAADVHDEAGARLQ